MKTHLLPTTVVGSYPQPDWLVDRELLARGVPRVRMTELWRVQDAYLEQAQDDATRLAITDMERAGLDIITDGEMRRESYSNRFATALDGIDSHQPALIRSSSGNEVEVPRVVGEIHRSGPVEVRDMEFLRANTDGLTKMTLPGPFTMAQQAHDEFYGDDEALAMAFASVVNEEAHAIQAAGANVIQIDEPWLRNNPAAAERFAVKAIDRALEGLKVTTAVHLCFGYAAVIHHEKPTGYAFLPQLGDCNADQISIECAQPNVDLGVLSELGGKSILLGVIDLSDPNIEEPEVVAARIRHGLEFVPVDRLIPAPDCGMKYLARKTAFGKLRSLAAGARIVRDELS